MTNTTLLAADVVVLADATVAAVATSFAMLLLLQLPATSHLWLSTLCLSSSVVRLVTCVCCWLLSAVCCISLLDLHL